MDAFATLTGSPFAAPCASAMPAGSISSATEMALSRAGMPMDMKFTFQKNMFKKHSYSM